MSDKWMIRGMEYSNCNCTVGCPCQFNAPSSHGKCEAFVSVKIDEGYFNDVPLSGLKFIVIFKWPGEIVEGNGEREIIIDEKATPEQREALEKIAQGECTAPGSTHFSVFDTTLSTKHETLFLPIDISVDMKNREAHVRAGDNIESKGSSMIDPFSGEKTRRGIHNPTGFEYTYAEVGVGNTSTGTSISLDLSESYGQFNELHMNQDGVIREAA